MFLWYSPKKHSNETFLNQHKIRNTMNRIGGSRRKISVSRFMQSFEEGQKVHLVVEPAYHKGMYHSRFIGKTGEIKGAKGRCYEVIINDHGKEKTLIVHPVHLKLSKG